MGVLIWLLVTSFLIAVSPAAACDRCLHQSKVSFFSISQPLQYGNCGYGTLALGFNDGHLAAAAPPIYKGGAGCGACFQVRCKDTKICKEEGTSVIVTDLNTDNRTDFVLSNSAVLAMAKNGSGQDLSKLGLVDVEYKRIPCNYNKNLNLSIRVEESSQKQNNYLAIKILYQGGQTEILTIDLAPAVEAGDWGSMRRNYGAVWDASRVPKGSLQFRFRVTAGYDGKLYLAKNVLPADWANGVVYDTGLQISDIAQESCSPCDLTAWRKTMKD